MSVHVQPMPQWMRTVLPRLQHCPPPIFPNCGPDDPTPEDVELARELFAILDPQSQAWYRRASRLFAGL